jgi:hypothetical protein
MRFDGGELKGKFANIENPNISTNGGKVNPEEKVH